MRLGQANRWAEACAAFERAADQQPASPLAWIGAATARQHLARTDAAIEAFRRAIALAPAMPAALSGLATALQTAGRSPEAATIFRRALTVSPDDAALRAGFAHTLRALGQVQEAEAQARLALHQDPTAPLAHIALGAALIDQSETDAARIAFAAAARLPAEPGAPAMATGMIRLLLEDYAGGWPGYEHRLRALAPACPEWDGTAPLAGRRLLVHAEQGMGDTIQFARFLPALAARGADISLLIQPPLRRLFASLPWPLVTEPPVCDLHAPLLSLPYRLRTTPQTITPPAPLLPPADSQATWAARLPDDGRLRVGLAWSGNPAHANDSSRSAPLATFLPLLATQNCRFVMAQTDLRPADAPILAAHPALEDHRAHLTDFAETAAMLSRLDLVITVDTSTAHLSASLGRPTWLLLAPLPDWRWHLATRRSPWYPSATLFRQPRAGDWAAVLREVAGQLGRKARGAAPGPRQRQRPLDSLR